MSSSPTVGATAPPRTGVRRHAAQLLLAIGLAAGLVVGLVVGLAAPASAHASVVSTTPIDGQSVPEPPAEFSVTFTESVDIELGGLSVLDRSGSRVDDGDTTVEDGGRVLRVPLKPDLDEGTYVGTWRVVSADGHAITGSAIFAVGVAVDASAASSLSARTDPTWEVVGAVARFVTFVSALLAAGLAFFLAFLHDQRRDRWKLVPVVRAASLVGLFAVLASIAAQAALATGLGLDAVTDLDVIRTVLTESLGWSAVVLLLGLALVHLSTDTSRLLIAQGCAFYGSLAVSASFVLWGHATEAPYRWLSVVADGAHVAAAALWFGGLVGLAMMLRRRAPQLCVASLGPTVANDTDRSAGRGTDATDGGNLALATPPDVTVTVPARRELLSSTATVLGRFSTVAAVSVVILLVSGVAMTWIQSGGSLSALWSTTYGRLVLTKVLLVVVVLALAAHNRQRLVPALTALAHPETPDPSPTAEPGDAPSNPTTTTVTPDDDPIATQGWERLRRNVVAEIAILVVVLAVTGVLVNVIPARTAAEIADSVVTLSAPADEDTVDLVVSPARAGVNTLRVQYRDAAGEPVDIANSLRVQFALPSAQLGPITREVVKIGPGTFVVQGSELSIPGDWDITLIVRPSDFREVRTPFTVEIR